MNNNDMTAKRDRARSVTFAPPNANNNIKKSNIVLIYICIVSVLVSELAISLYLYTYINNHTYVNKINIRHEIEQILRDNLRKAAVRDDIGEIIRNYVKTVEKDVIRTTTTASFGSPGSTSTEPTTIKVSIANQDNGTGEEFFKYTRYKRAALDVEDNTVTQGAVDDGKFVEFFNPKLRQELEAKDELEKRRTGLKGAAPGGDNWVWLNSYSRMPYNAIEGFCKATREYCPPGRPGAKGAQGERGYPGASGLPGQRGEIGWPGHPGLDGRDGIPGEPGLDGLPGRSGADGIPGIDGAPGRDGVHGKDGANGIDGRPGLMGPQGPLGPQGPRGLSGPRGKAGRPGSDGTPGIPGVQSWKITTNGTDDLLIPPSISGGATLSPIIVHEGENLRLRCAATGTPRPDVEWRRTDGKVISMGSWQASSVPGHTLNITHINREHMGSYQCTANNGIPPVANQTFQLEVHFPPLIKIRNLRIGVANGSTAVMECEVEAFPEALRYWERSDGRLLEHGDKYRIETENHGYRSVMRLNVTRATSRDCTIYHCLAKNEMGITRGSFTVYEIDPSLSTPPPTKPDAINTRVSVYGKRPPEKVSLDDLCPAPTVCQECPDPKDFKCKDAAVSLFDLVGHLEIRPLGNATYPGLPNRTLDCLLYAVGKPVYHRFTDEPGAWMRDSSPRNDIVGEKLWATREKDNKRLFEYNNKTAFRRDQPSRIYELLNPFRGNSHVVYNGSFYYHELNGSRVLRYDLASERYAGNFNVPLVSTNSDNFLYTTGLNYIDFSVDDNGLWIIFGIPSSNNTAVIKLDHETMQAQYMWNISVNHHKVGEMFIVCGVLYAVDSVTDRETTIRLALDLYRNVLHYPELTFTNPFRNTTMIGYNHRSKELYTWDKGNQLTYPVRYHEIGYNITDKDQKDETLDSALSQMRTGFDVYP